MNLTLNFKSIASVSLFRIVGYLLAFSMLILVEKIYGVYGLGIYGVILFLSSIVRYLSLGLSDLFLLRASKCSKSIVKKLYFMYMMLGFTSLIFFFAVKFAFYGHN